MLKFKEYLELVKHNMKSDPYRALDYARGGGDDPEAKEVVKTNSDTAYQYARDVIHGPWPEAEKIIGNNPHTAAAYVEDIIKDRFPEFEKMIQINPFLWRRYLEMLKGNAYTDEDKLKWIKEEGVTDNLLEVLNFLGTSEKVQECIIKARPDLINKITNLKPNVERRHAHELSLSRVEI